MKSPLETGLCVSGETLFMTSSNRAALLVIRTAGAPDPAAN